MHKYVHKYVIKIFCLVLIMAIAGTSSGLITNSFADEFLDSDFEESDTFPELDPDISSMEDTEYNKDDPENSLSRLSLGGFLKFRTEYGYNRYHKKLSRVETALFLESDYKINDNLKFRGSVNAFYDFAYAIESRSEFSQETLDDNEYDIAVKEFFLDGKLSNRLSIKAGRQVVVFGESEYARILDVVNPRDLTRPGLISIEDARLPVNVIRLSYFSDNWLFDAASTHEHPGSDINGAGSDFDYYASIRRPGIIILNEKRGKSGFRSPGFALRAKKSFNGGDISFVAANTYDDRPYLNIKALTASGLVLQPKYNKYRTLGMSGNLVKGPVLFKFEGAFQNNIKLMRNDILKKINAKVPFAEIKTTRKSDKIALLAGLEYTGITNLRINFEVEKTHILSHEHFLSDEQNEYRTYTQATYSMMHNTLEFDILWVYFHPGNGNILRLTTEYDLFDGLSILAGAAFYQSRSDSSTIYPYNNQDRIFFQLKYSF